MGKDLKFVGTSSAECSMNNKKMKIHEFNIEKGIYKFELGEMKTEIHSHPAFEIMFSKNGGIDLEVENCKYRNVSLAIIEPNTPHKIEFKKANVIVLMIECNVAYLKKRLLDFDIVLSEGVYAGNKSNDNQEFIEEIIFSVCHTQITIALDERVQKALNYLNNTLNNTSSDYKEIMKDLKLRTHLSESRISHLFKKEIGISIKKYFVWSKLKKAFKSVVQEEKNMYDASIENGFYDQAHLSNAFKQMLGITPSDVYNSRMLQV